MADGNAAPLEGVIALTAFVQFSPGAVVSRTLLKKDTGTITAFAFDAGEELSATCSGCPRGQPHAVKAVTPFKMLLIMIREVQKP